MAYSRRCKRDGSPVYYLDDMCISLLIDTPRLTCVKLSASNTAVSVLRASTCSVCFPLGAMAAAGCKQALNGLR